MSEYTPFQVGDSIVAVHPHGPIRTTTRAVDNHNITESIYPLCGGRVETSLVGVTVQPHTYKRRVIYNNE